MSQYQSLWPVVLPNACRMDSRISQHRIQVIQDIRLSYYYKVAETPIDKLLLNLDDSQKKVFKLDKLLVFYIKEQFYVPCNFGDIFWQNYIFNMDRIIGHCKYAALCKYAFHRIYPIYFHSTGRLSL